MAIQDIGWTEHGQSALYDTVIIKDGNRISNRNRNDFQRHSEERDRMTCFPVKQRRKS